MRRFMIDEDQGTNGGDPNIDKCVMGKEVKPTHFISARDKFINVFAHEQPGGSGRNAGSSARRSGARGYRQQLMAGAVL